MQLFIKNDKTNYKKTLTISIQTLFSDCYDYSPSGLSGPYINQHITPPPPYLETYTRSTLSSLILHVMYNVFSTFVSVNCRSCLLYQFKQRFSPLVIFNDYMTGDLVAVSEKNITLLHIWFFFSIQKWMRVQVGYVNI